MGGRESKSVGGMFRAVSLNSGALGWNSHVSDEQAVSEPGRPLEDHLFLLTYAQIVGTPIRPISSKRVTVRDFLFVDIFFK